LAGNFRKQKLLTNVVGERAHWRCTTHTEWRHAGWHGHLWGYRRVGNARNSPITRPSCVGAPPQFYGTGGVEHRLCVGRADVEVEGHVFPRNDERLGRGNVARVDATGERRVEVAVQHSDARKRRVCKIIVIGVVILGPACPLTSDFDARAPRIEAVR